MKHSIKSERGLAAQIISTVIFKKQSLTSTLNHFLNSTTPSPAFVKELSFGSLRWYLRLSAILERLLNKNIKDKTIYSLLLIGLYQLIYLNLAHYAVVNETVNVAKELKKEWAIKLINAVLRNFLRHQSVILEKVDKDLQPQYAHPVWLINKIQTSWTEQWSSILQANNQHPPLSLRVNAQKVPYITYIEWLKREGLAVYPQHFWDNDVTLAQPIEVNKIPGFSEGCVSVQDVGAQCAAYLLDLKTKQRVLDACAAPGGKTTHILEMQPHLEELVALDSDKIRLNKVKENLDRLNLKATLINQDANNTSQWWNKKLFDRILLDAPCSATGVIRRHPDIKILRKPSDIEGFVEQQKNLLNNLWPLLRPQGILLYATCSILPEENEEVIKEFLKNHPSAKEDVKYPTFGIKKVYGWQILPSSQYDGFFYCRLIKND